MRALLVVIVVVGLTALFISQKRREKSPDAAVASQIEPRQVSEHDWAKHALDKTNAVGRKVTEQRKQNAVP